MTNDQAIQLPADLQQSILLPLARYKFSTWVHFNNKDAAKQLEADARAALERLKTLTPQRQQAKRVTIGGY
jgi:hypothetical protein